MKSEQLYIFSLRIVQTKLRLMTVKIFLHGKFQCFIYGVMYLGRIM